MRALVTAAIASAAWAIVALGWTAARVWRRTPPPVAAAAAGRSWAGVIYAFGAGMSPLAKESAREHPIVYTFGVTYHAGVFAALAAFALTVVGAAVPRPVAVTLSVVGFAAAASGVVLLGRRAASPLLRAISAPDDYASNVLVDLWIAAAAVSWLAIGAAQPFLALSIAVALYAPLGKIRHCVFFFLSRGLFGARLGRRGIVRAPFAGAAR